MEHAITRTRIIVPRRRSDLYTRKRLVDLLNDLIDKKLILISAPAGYGKTSLLADFSSTTELPVCWYSIDELDFEPQRFISNFIYAINVKFPEFGQRSKSILQNASQGSLDVDYLATVIINELYEFVSEHFIIILDDYHLVNEHPLISKFISHFIQDVDENCHLILTSRTLLSLPILPLMVARSEVGGLSLDELAFQVDEIQGLFFQNRSQTVSRQAAADLIKRTEGWITGIILTSQISPQTVANHARINRVSGVSLEEYFLYVLDQQSPQMRDFLLRTSLLEEFNAELCERVVSQALSLTAVDWDGLINAVLRNNLFALPVGDDGAWLRYHNLFLEFLQARFLRESGAEALAIRRTLAQYYIQHSDWEKAYAIYQHLGMTDELIELVERNGPDLVFAGRMSTLASWIDALPMDIINNRPTLVSLQGMVASMKGDTSLALTLYDQAISAMEETENVEFLARTLVRRANTYRMMGNLQSSIHDAQQSLNLLEGRLALRPIKADALRCMGICMYQQGKLNEALTWLTRALETCQSIKDRKNEAIIRMELGMVYEAMGNYKVSKQMYLAALEYWQQADNPIWLSNLFNNLGVLQHLMGDYEAALSSLEKALYYSRISGYSRLEAFAITGVGDIYWELEALDEAVTAYQQARMIAQRTGEDFLQVYLDVQEAALVGIQGNYSTAYRLIDDARYNARCNGSVLEGHLVDLEFAGIKIWEKKPQEGIAALEEACRFFESEGNKAQSEKAHLYLSICYGQIDNREKLLEHLVKVLAYMKAADPPVSLIAAASKFEELLLTLRNMDYIGSQLDELFDRIEKFKDQVPALRRNLRQQAVTVPFAPPTIYIRALGKMQVRQNNHVLGNSDWQTLVARDLFFLLLAHPEGMTKEEITVIFWPDGSPEDIKFRFKNMVYRLRHAIGKDVIVLEGENYRFNNALDYEYDVETFLKENALAQQSKDQLTKLGHFLEAIKLCKGVYLPDLADTWVLMPRESLQQIYLNILVQVTELYIQMQNYDLASEYCQRALDADNCMEVAYRLSLRIYAAMGNRPAVVRQYQRLCEVLKKEINAAPSSQTQALYQDLIQ